MSQWQNKCWGKTRIIYQNADLLRYELEVISNSYCSIHYHENRTNRFILKSGVVSVIVFGNGSYTRHDLKIDEPLDIDPGTLHLFIVIQEGNMIEEYFDKSGRQVEESDIIRLCQGGIAEFNNIEELVDALLRDISDAQ